MKQSETKSGHGKVKSVHSKVASITSRADYIEKSVRNPEGGAALEFRFPPNGENHEKVLDQAWIKGVKVWINYHVNAKGENIIESASAS